MKLEDQFTMDNAAPYIEACMSFEIDLAELGNHNAASDYLLSTKFVAMLYPFLVATQRASGDDSPEKYKIIKEMNDDIIKTDSDMFNGLSQIALSNDGWDNTAALNEYAKLHETYTSQLRGYTVAGLVVVGRLKALKPDNLENSMIQIGLI